ncbi:MAG TPA: glycosyl hydrolase 115 family protein, partial [Lacibacter sp.]|nr:glycosyl hydrolase 115 family protein [Lacibacter sp.]
TGRAPVIRHRLQKNDSTVVFIGTTNLSSFIRQLERRKRINTQTLRNQWEGYLAQSVRNPLPGIRQGLVLAGSDRRGTAWAVMELVQQMGVSPWYWWADVPVQKQAGIFIDRQLKIQDRPLVKYRGIFINDEAPALSNWSSEKFGGFNHRFYEKVFELMLRLKANYLWPAMWGNAFYDDDARNREMADAYGIVIGTSHHEPLMRAHDEWRRHGKGKWNYDSNTVALEQFWTKGLERATNEKIVTIGMRGDGDEPMTEETATALLERIVAAQRNLIEQVSGKPAHHTPQLWALYKEVQEYYDKGMRVPDDVTLLLCDDNWGNLRRLPQPGQPLHKGGYGIYYHYDYVGGPRNYKWLNTNPLPRVWEQMHLAWQHKVDQIWIVNVGDIKPMELPISFFLDLAWNPNRIEHDQINDYTIHWAAAQFGPTYAREIAELLAAYAKINGRRKPELLDANTYTFHYNEWQRVRDEYDALWRNAEAIKQLLPQHYHDAYFQLVLHPTKACANLYDLYYHVALNKKAFGQKWNTTDTYARRVRELFVRDSLISIEYHRLNNGKWNHLMSQTHIGYTSWQQPPYNIIPQLNLLPDSIAGIPEPAAAITVVAKATVPPTSTRPAFYERDKTVSIPAASFTKAINSQGIEWKVLPDHGRTGDAVTSFPVTAAASKPGGDAPHLQYEFYTYNSGKINIQSLFSPTLNIYGSDEGLQYGISVNDGPVQIVSLNKEDKTNISGIWNKWVSENCIVKTTEHILARPGKQILKFWRVNNAVVLQQLLIDLGGMQASYLGPPATIVNK